MGATDVRFQDEFDFLPVWRQTLAQRTHQAVASLSAIPDVVGLVLAGGLGRGAEWPLSDIDLIGIYADQTFEQTKAHVDRVRTDLMAQWSAQGFAVSLDIKGIVFTASEVESAVRSQGSRVLPLLSDKRFYHGMDKVHGGQSVYDPDGLATSFLEWVNRERYSDEVKAARIAAKRRIRDEAQRTAQDLLDTQAQEATLSVAVDAAIVANTHLLMEIWGDRGSSRRGPTFSERCAAEQGETALVDDLFRLRRFDLASGHTRIVQAPELVRRYASFSLEARALVGEEVTTAQNTRDAVVWEQGRVLREEDPPYAPWVGVDCDPASIGARFDRLSDLIGSHLLLQ
jgi:hypothetical protein